MLALGRLSYNESSKTAIINGKLWDDRNMGSYMTVERSQAGRYVVSFAHTLSRLLFYKQTY